ncbi:MAG: nucleotidyltransferase domain-containing protein [Nitrospirae bacterium]|nr:nucleotidyltransferase domain-containing protein [Nitrospirota bacterium]MDA1302841.1 nucleotidyltransferase domain-containing protein [Nitrospirota bacterium]
MQKLLDSATLIEEMVRRIVETWNPVQIILFGSYARGTAGPDSDVDFLVVMARSEDRRNVRLGIRRALSGMGLPKDIVVVTPQEIERYRECPGTIIRAALGEGKVLYEQKP